ncbi:16S rRNA (cytosine(1402)-N(4))-methyltransferase RsmH [Selenomonadales bacterium OttesenSCG-928-I06]|nr:16S rRNA (cytosine(1402)-N(4))-methyltransferase RsmH [Selenomonadales bacterium OttesenSCG-928-I06]
MPFRHTSVLLEETINNIFTKPEGIYVDCTLGGAGHSLELAKLLNENGLLIGIDQDEEAIKKANQVLKDVVCRVELIKNNFQNLDKILDELNIEKVDGVIFDLGVSSYQLDNPERGFSYMKDAPLDMRMDSKNKFSAFDVVNTYSEEELTNIFYKYGEEKFSKRIAKFIINSRKEKLINTTFELTEIIKSAIPAKMRRTGPHPAKRTFQAIRIEVNNELNILHDTFAKAIKRLNTKGRIAIITFHSLEDKIAKQTFKEFSTSCICPKSFPVCVCNQKAEIKILGKPIIPNDKELEENHRARSAKLRIAEKI